MLLKHVIEKNIGLSQKCWREKYERRQNLWEKVKKEKETAVIQMARKVTKPKIWKISQISYNKEHQKRNISKQ